MWRYLCQSQIASNKIPKTNTLAKRQYYTGENKTHSIKNKSETQSNNIIFAFTVNYIWHLCLIICNCWRKPSSHLDTLQWLLWTNFKNLSFVKQQQLNRQFPLSVDDNIGLPHFNFHIWFNQKRQFLANLKHLLRAVIYGRNRKTSWHALSGRKIFKYCSFQDA